VGGFGSERHGDTVTAEGTASYVLNISSLAPALRKGGRLTGSIRIDEDRFPVVLIVDVTNEWSRFVELMHLTPDDREGHRTRSANFHGAHLRGAALVVPMPADRLPHDQAISAERRLALLEPPGGLRTWVRFSMRRPLQSSPAESGRAEP